MTANIAVCVVFVTLAQCASALYIEQMKVSTSKDSSLDIVTNALTDSNDDASNMNNHHHSNTITSALQNPIEDMKRWPNGKIPYQITSYFPNRVMGQIQQAMEAIHKGTCIRWIAADRQHDKVINFMRGTGCYSSLGKMSRLFGRTQDLSLQVPGCDTHATIVHEMMHAIGFNHEQNRWDRDKYIRVHEDKIQPKQLSNFRKSGRPTRPGWERFPYELTSVMHYNKVAFGITPYAETMTPLDPRAEIGNEVGMTKMDIEQINFLYNCHKPGPVTPTPVGPGVIIGDKLPPPEDILRNLTIMVSVLDFNSQRNVPNDAVASIHQRYDVSSLSVFPATLLLLLIVALLH